MTQHTFYFLVAILCIASTFACTNENTSNPVQTNTTQQEKTITGTVGYIRSGKDGYTTTIRTDKGETYTALVSIPNIGNKEDYTRFKVGDLVTVSGEIWQNDNQQQLTVRKIINVDSSHATPYILENAYRNIKPGDHITTHQAYIQKDQLKTGEGTFEVYRIKGMGQDDTAIGYFHPDPNDETLVGDIIIDIPQAQTMEGIHIGSIFENLKSTFPSIAVHGSEIEGRTYAQYNNLSYRLDMPNFTYEVDMDKIPTDTEITEIVINRKGIK